MCVRKEDYQKRRKWKKEQEQTKYRVTCIILYSHHMLQYTLHPFTIHICNVKDFANKSKKKRRRRKKHDANGKRK